MMISPNGYEIVREEGKDYENTAEKAISIGFEDAMEDKGRDCDYEFTIQERQGRKIIHCLLKLDQGYEFMFHHPAGQTPDLPEVERNAYQFLLERL